MDTIEYMEEKGDGLVAVPAECMLEPKLWKNGSAFYDQMLNASISGETGDLDLIV